MNKRKTAVVISVAVIMTLCFTTVTAGAESLSELRKQISEKQQELDEGKEQEQSLSSQLNKLEQAIAENENNLTVLEGELAEAEEEVDTQTENLNDRLRAMYKNGSVGFIDVLWIRELFGISQQSEHGGTDIFQRQRGSQRS